MLIPEQPRPLRQFGTAILTSLVSLALVIGGLSLALAEGAPVAPPPTITQGPDTLPTLTFTMPPLIVTETPTLFLVVGTPTNALLSSQTPFLFTATASLASTAGLGNTPITCGPPYGWVKTYVVQPGDSLFRIAQNYYTAAAELQRANCKGNSTTINVGQLLWVPNVAPRTPAVTVVPDFPTSTYVPTEPLTQTALPFTSSPEPSNTPLPTETPASPPSP
jgi:hypothetical protein